MSDRSLKSRKSQPTNRVQIPPAPTEEKIATPKGGWDKNWDVREAVRVCRNLRGAITNNVRDDDIICQTAENFYDLGISENTAVRLICRFCDTPRSRKNIAEIAGNAYRNKAKFIPPGLRSLTGPPGEDDAYEAPPEVQAMGWPVHVDFDEKQHAGVLLQVFLEQRPGRLVSSDAVLYSMDPETKLWSAISDVELANEIRRCDVAMRLSPAKISEMVKAAHVDVLTKARPFEWITPPDQAPAPEDLILFRNGMLDARTNEFLPHTGDFFATGLPDFDYDPDAECPLWNACLIDWLDVSYHDTLMQAVGYLMTGDTSLQKMLVFIGASRGGKGTITRVIKDLVGTKLQGSITLHDFGDSFGLQGVLEKRLVIVPDASDVKLSNRSNALERIKSITGNDEISINRKHLPILGDVRLHTKLLLVANSHPKFLDESGALANREIPIEFEQSFLGREDPHLGTKLRAELPGIANMAIEALRTLRQNGGRFTTGRAGRAAIREIERNTSPALRFADAFLQITGDKADFTPHDLIFERYEAWADAESLGGHERRNRDDFRKDLKAAIGHRGVSYTRQRWRDPDDKNRGKSPRVWGWRGIRINSS